jgi:hypothetical protein
MSRTTRLAAALATIAVLTVAVAAYAVWSAVNEKARNQQHCRDIGADPVHTSGSRYLCVTADGRVLP